jgi:hypothetical protein
MEDRLIEVYRAPTVSDAQRFADVLHRAGIEAFVESTEAPMYGAPVGPSGKCVRVREPVVAEAEALVADFEQRWHKGVPPDEWPAEETGGELPTLDRPSDDSPTEEMDVGNERLAADPPGAEAPEAEQFVVEPDSPAAEREGLDTEVGEQPPVDDVHPDEIADVSGEEREGFDDREQR